MKYQLATVIVTNTVRNNLRLLAARLDKNDMDNMFTTGLSASGNLPATHWVSSGYVPKPLVKLMRDSTLMFTIAKAKWEADGDVFPFTQSQVTNALAACFLSAGATDTEEGLPQEPLTFITASGLKLVTTTI